MNLRPLVRTAALTAAALAVSATPAAAVHWPHFGGDAGRSGLQPVGGGGPPFTEAYVLGGLHVDTSIVTTAGGGPDVQRLAFGTADGRVHLRRLSDGAAVTPPDGVEVVANHGQPHPFGEDTAAFADTSTASALGQLLAVHNDTDQGQDGEDVALAVLDEASGRLLRDEALRGTQNLRIRSAVVATAADAEGNRALLFVAEGGTGLLSDTVHLVRVRLTSAGEVLDVDVVGIENGTPQATPSLAFLTTATGAPAAHVLVGVSGGVRSYRVSDLGSGPAAEALPGDVLTLNAPVTAAGQPAGAPMSGATRAPFLTALVDRGGRTQVIRLAQEGDRLKPGAQSAVFEAAPGAGLADSQVAASDGASAGALVVPTARELYVLDGTTLATRAVLPQDPHRAHGFQHVAPAVLGDVAFITRSSGEHVALRVSTGRALESSAFNESAANRDSERAVGQPSITRGFVQMASDRGVVVYRATPPQAPAAAPAPAQGAAPAPAAAPGACARARRGGRGADRLLGTAGGDRLSGLRGDDLLLGMGGDDCLSGGRGDDVLYGGRGRDVLRCGTGRDIAFADRRDRVRGCERVVRR